MKLTPKIGAWIARHRRTFLSQFPLDGLWESVQVTKEVTYDSDACYRRRSGAIYGVADRYTFLVDHSDYDYLAFDLDQTKEYEAAITNAKLALQEAFTRGNWIE